MTSKTGTITNLHLINVFPYSSYFDFIYPVPQNAPHVSCCEISLRATLQSHGRESVVGGLHPVKQKSGGKRFPWFMAMGKKHENRKKPARYRGLSHSMNRDRNLSVNKFM